MNGGKSLVVDIFIVETEPQMSGQKEVSNGFDSWFNISHFLTTVNYYAASNTSARSSNFLGFCLVSVTNYAISFGLFSNDITRLDVNGRGMDIGLRNAGNS